MLNNRVTREEQNIDTEKETVKKAQWITHLLSIQSSLRVSLRMRTCTHTHVCILDRKSPRRRSRAGEKSELKIDYRRTDYHNKGEGRWSNDTVSASVCVGTSRCFILTVNTLSCRDRGVGIIISFLRFIVEKKL